MAPSFASLYRPTESGCKDHPDHEVHRHVEDFLDGKVLNPTATPVVEEVLFDQALLHHLVYAGRTMAGSLRESGLSAELHYCTSSTHGHPVPFIIARNADGELVVPTTAPRQAQCAGSAFYLVNCAATETCSHLAPSANESDQPLIALTKGAIVVIPSRMQESSAPPLPIDRPKKKKHAQ
jgi:hypothetical protein